MSRHHILDPETGFRVTPKLCALGIMTKVPEAGKVNTTNASTYHRRSGSVEYLFSARLSRIDYGGDGAIVIAWRRNLHTLWR